MSPLRCANLMRLYVEQQLFCGIVVARQTNKNFARLPIWARYDNGKGGVTSRAVCDPYLDSKKSDSSDLLDSVYQETFFGVRPRHTVSIPYGLCDKQRRSHDFPGWLYPSRRWQGKYSLYWYKSTNTDDLERGSRDRTLTRLPRRPKYCPHPTQVHLSTCDMKRPYLSEMIPLRIPSNRDREWVFKIFIGS